MSRHSRAMQELAKRVHDGAIGEIILQRGYRMHGPDGYFHSLPTPQGTKELMYQIQRFHSFLWASGGNYSDFYIHVIDHLCWMKNAWPVKAAGAGRSPLPQEPRGDLVHRPELRHVLGGIHVRRRDQVLLRRPLHGRL